MNKHNTEDYWDCNCRHYDEKNPSHVSYPGDDCEHIHERYVMLINELQKLVEYNEPVLTRENTGYAIIESIKDILRETGDV